MTDVDPEKGSHVLAVVRDPRGQVIALHRGASSKEVRISSVGNQGKWVPVFDVICTVALPIITSAYVGLAEAAARVAKESAKKRAHEPQLPFELGEMENALVSAQMARRELIGLAANYDFKPSVELANAALIRKSICVRSVQACVAKAVEVQGGGAYFKTSRLEQWFRDAQAGNFHPLPEKKQQLFTGRLALVGFAALLVGVSAWRFRKQLG